AGPRFWTINADGAAHVARATAEVGARLIHISSDSVFDGEHAPYCEADPPSPITPYGASKAAAETAVGALLPGAAIVRTSLIVDDDPLDNHSRTVMDIAAGRRSVALFTDEIRCPIAAADLAAAVIELIDLPYAGPLHVVGPDDVSRYELGTLVARRYALDPALLAASTLAESGLRRPADLRLDTGRARELLGTPLRGVREFLSPIQPA
ncbi:MAG TPA: sugar nucleotide-binding protein, partial [Herpetosiphonaceae bacterium]|nr:sugar nucleotide-binding protein [Herpetosiphonaceae bacterium]